MTIRGRWAAFLWLGALATLGADDPAKPKSTADRAVAPITPDLPGAVVAAMQEGKYAEAGTGIDLLIARATSPSDKSYYRFLLGIVERLANKSDNARATLAEALRLDPKGPWAAKIRFELAADSLAAGKPAEAEALARVEAETLLSADRKDRLAEVYHSFARRLLAPDELIAKPDPAGAYALLAKARELAKGETLRASLLFEMGQAARRIGPSSTSIGDFQAYLRQYPNGADRFAARFHLGEAQLATGQAVAARMTWTDLARDLDRVINIDQSKPIPRDWVDLRDRSLYQIARTHNIPEPPDDTQLNLGVAALRRFLVAAPAHPKAVRASFEIGQSYLHRNQGEAAIEAFQSFLKGDGYRAESDEARRDLADLAMTATFLVARTLQGQGKFAEAIAADKGYLARFPNGPQSADAQRAILDTQLQIASDAQSRQKYADARAAWQVFVSQNPLDARVPQVLYEVGASFQTEKKFDEAIAALEALIGKFPGSEPAAHAQFDVASILEVEKGDLPAAIERFRKVADGPWKPMANHRVIVMESKALKVVTPRAFRSGETAHLKITSRNLENLTFTGL